MIRVLLVDDQALLRSGLRVLIEGEQDLVVVGEAGEGAQAAALARLTQPDVVLMDISMPGVDGVEATRRIRADVPESQVLMVTGSDSREDVDAARSAGAAGYVTKDKIAAELIGAIFDASR